ncbi:MAG: CPBP family intramembrane glutamic endopeptidase [Pseudomonadota bacterium]
MRSFAIFIGLIALGLAGMAFLAYPAWVLLAPHFDLKFHRVASRIGMLLLVAGFILIARRLQVADRQSMGYGLPFRAFIAQLSKAVVLGIVMMMPALATMIAFDLRQPVGAPLDAYHWFRLAMSGLITGLTVAFIEETFLRGAMQSAITRESGAKVAIVLTSLVYAATHFIGRARIAPAEVNSSSGLVMLERALSEWAHPLAFVDAFACLAAVGVLLGMVRALTGNIAASIGLHAGWVAVIYVVRETSERRPTGPATWLLSDFDGFIGWLVLAWIVALGFALHRWYSAQAPFIPRLAVPGGD